MKQESHKGSNDRQGQAFFLYTFKVEYGEYRSRIHERTISLRFLGIILRVLRLEVSV
jgi:hypothetical protein